MRPAEDNDPQPGYELLDVSSRESRMAILCDRIRLHAGKHDNIEGALSCMARGVYTQVLADLIAKLGHVDTEHGVEVAALLADLLVDAAPPNLRSILLLGEAFALYADAIDGNTVPLRVVQAYTSAGN